MKKILLLLMVAIATESIAQDITGSWMGLMDAGGNNIRLVFHVKKTADGYSATFDSPDQKAFGIACSKATVTTDSLLLEIAIINGGYKGKRNGKDEITGIYYQGQGSSDFKLKRLADTEIPKPEPSKIRPQTPKPPFNYDAENVDYYNADKSVHFGATFTKPKGIGTFPTVIIITGSGTQDRDGTMFGHKIYAVLAEYLTNNGIAVLRVDDRGAGKTTLGKNFMKLTSADFANDVETGIAYLQTRADVGKIGLIGHSEGGMIAPMVAARNKAVNFIVLLAGPGQTGEEIWKYQMRKSFEKPNLVGADKKLADELVNKMNEAFMHSDTLQTIINEMNTTYASWKASVSDSTQKRILNITGAKEFIDMAKKYRTGLSWLKYFMLYNPAYNLQAVKCPILAANGEKDIQVPCRENLAAIASALKKGSSKSYTIKSFGSLNHLFQTCKTKEQPYDEIDETFAPIALSYITDWIQQRTK